MPRRTAQRWASEPDVRRQVENWRRRILDRALGYMAGRSMWAVKGIAKLGAAAESESSSAQGRGGPSCTTRLLSPGSRISNTAWPSSRSKSAFVMETGLDSDWIVFSRGCRESGSLHITPFTGSPFYLRKNLSRRCPEGRREEAEFWRLVPRTSIDGFSGVLLDAVVGALREIPSVRLAKLPRMADFARFGESLARGMGWPPETFLTAYLENRRDATATTLDDSVFGTFLLERLSYWEPEDIETMSPAEWLAHFNRYKEHKATTSPRWPKTPVMLGNEPAPASPFTARTWRARQLQPNDEIAVDHDRARPGNRSAVDIRDD